MTAPMHSYDPETARLAEAVVTYALERVHLDPPPLDHSVPPSELAEQVGPTITPEGIGGIEALRRWAEVLAPACISVDHPRFLAFVPAAPTEAAVLFDLVVGASSVFGGTWMEGAGAVHVENEALAWLASLAGYPSSAGGVFLSGGSAGNLSALVTARHWWRSEREQAGRGAVVCSPGAHSSVRAAAHVMDIDVLVAGTDDDGRLTADTLRAALKAADAARGRASGSGPGTAGLFAVVANGGTTNAGIVDDLAGVAEVCGDAGLWLHVDAAYGGAALAAPSTRPVFDGIERSDSFVVDPHKWLFAPYDCAALVYRHPGLARAAHTQHAEYLDVIHDRVDWNPSDYAFHLSRRARGLPFWFSLATYGTRAYAEAVEATLTTTRAAATLIDEHRSAELVREPSLSVVLFRRPGWTPADYSDWSERLLADGVGFVVPTSWEGETVLRFCFINPRTTVDDVRLILDSLV